MTIRTIDFPSHLMRVQENSFRLRPIGEAFQSSYNPTPRASGPRYKLWSASITANYLHETNDHDQRFEWEAFVHSLDGMATAFTLWDAARTLPKGAAAGLSKSVVSTEYKRVLADSSEQQFTTTSKLISGSTYALLDADAARYADEIVLSGLVANATVFRAGDLIGIGGNLHEVQQLAISDASGRSAIRLNNRLWRPALEGDQVTVVKPTGRFILASNDEGITTRNTVTASGSMSVMEFPYHE